MKVRLGRIVSRSRLASTRSKYSHHMPQASAKPAAAASAAAVGQPPSAPASATTTIVSPKTMIVNRPKRSGMCSRESGISLNTLGPKIGVAISMASPSAQAHGRTSCGSASEASHTRPPAA